MSSKDNLTKYQKLSEIEHVLARGGMYVGSTANTDTEGFIYNHAKKRMEWKSYTYNPALIKLFDEIISNSVDEHKRGGSVTKIEVDVCRLTGSISVADDGGIPVAKHPDHGMYIPEMIFGEMRTGSNFGDDDRTTAGLNGIGSVLVNIYSREFKVVTADGKNKFVQVYKNNLSERSTPTILKSKERGTTITFTPDYKRLNCSLDAGNIERITRRVYDVAGCNPKIKVYLNGELINIKSFGEYVSLYVGDKDQFIEQSNKDWHIAIASSNEAFRHISFVNGVDTFNGGSHVDYITNQITTKLREYIKKKHKVDIRPANIKQHLFVFINCTINAPVFTSQTKEFMSSDVKDFGTSFEVTDKLINALVKGDIVQRILDWAESQQRQKELAELRKMNKQTQTNNYLKKIVKFDDATSKDRMACALILTEGDSAAKAILSARDPKTIGVFPLKGKPLNVRDIKVSKLTANEEFANIMSIIGLKLGENHTIEDLRFGKVFIGADQDDDGAHIAGLVMNMFQQYWPNLIKEGFLVRLNTPVIVATTGKTKHEFFSRSEYNDWLEANNNPKHSFKWFKGLGSWTSKDFARFISDSKYHEPLVYVDQEDFDAIDLAFDKSRADDRKEWLAS